MRKEDIELFIGIPVKMNAIINGMEFYYFCIIKSVNDETVHFVDKFDKKIALKNVDVVKIQEVDKELMEENNH